MLNLEAGDTTNRRSERKDLRFFPLFLGRSRGALWSPFFHHSRGEGVQRLRLRLQTVMKLMKRFIPHLFITFAPIAGLASEEDYAMVSEVQVTALTTCTIFGLVKLIAHRAGI